MTETQDAPASADDMTDKQRVDAMPSDAEVVALVRVSLVAPDTPGTTKD